MKLLHDSFVQLERIKSKAKSVSLILERQNLYPEIILSEECANFIDVAMKYSSHKVKEEQLHDSLFKLFTSILMYIDYLAIKPDQMVQYYDSVTVYSSSIHLVSSEAAHFIRAAMKFNRHACDQTFMDSTACKLYGALLSYFSYNRMQLDNIFAFVENKFDVIIRHSKYVD